MQYTPGLLVKFAKNRLESKVTVESVIMRRFEIMDFSYPNKAIYRFTLFSLNYD